MSKPTQVRPWQRIVSMIPRPRLAVGVGVGVVVLGSGLALLMAAPAQAQAPRPGQPVPLRSFNVPGAGLAPPPAGGWNPGAGGVVGSQWQIQTQQLLLASRQLREECLRLNLPGLVRPSIVIQANTMVQRAEAIHLAAKQNQLGTIPSLRSGFNQSFQTLTRSLTPFSAGNPGLRQAISQVEFAEQQLDGLNSGGGLLPPPGLPGGGGSFPNSEPASRMARAVESQTEQLRAVIQDASAGPPDRTLSRRLRSFGLGNRQLAEALERGASQPQAWQTYTQLVETWRGLVQAIAIPFGTNAIVQTQASRVNSLMADLGTLLQGGGINPPINPPILPPGPGIFPPDRRLLVTGAGQDGGPHVKLTTERNAPTQDFFAYDVNYRGGVRVAVADLNGDGVPDLVTAPGRGHIPLIRVFDGRDARLLAEFVAYDPPYDLGVFVAAADYSVHGRALIAVGPGDGGPPHVRVFDLVQGRLIDEIYPYAKELRCGVRVAFGDFNRDGWPDLVTVPGPGNGPHVRIFNGQNGQPMGEFNAVEDSFRGGLFVAVADITRNGRSDLVIGTDAGRLGQLRVFDGLQGRLLASLEPYGRNYRQGIRVATYDLDQDRIPDLVAAPGVGAALPVRIYSGANQRLLHEFAPYAGAFSGGIFIAGR